MQLTFILDGEDKLQPQSLMQTITNKFWGTRSSIKLFTARIHDRLLPYLYARWFFCAISTFGLIMRFYYLQKRLWLFFWYFPCAVSAIHAYFEPKYVEMDYFSPKYGTEKFKTPKTDGEHRPFIRASCEFEVWTLLCFYCALTFAVSFIQHWTDNFIFWWLLESCCRTRIWLEMVWRLKVMKMLGYNSWSIKREKKTAKFFITARMKKENVAQSLDHEVKFQAKQLNGTFIV